MGATARAGEKNGRTAVEVLVVDDCYEVRQVLGLLLSTCGYHVHEAGSGDEAVALVQGRPGRIRFALLDVWMPGRDGRDTARALRQLEPDLPFIFMTGDPSRVSVAELMALGAGTVLLKPFDLQQVVDYITAAVPVRKPATGNSHSAASP